MCRTGCVCHMHMKGCLSSLKLHMLKPNLQYCSVWSESFGRWSGPEGSVFMNGTGRNPRELHTLSTACMCVCSIAQLCPMNCPMDCSSSVHGISQARILEWVAISFSRGSSWPRSWTHISCISCMGRWVVYHWATWEASTVWGHSKKMVVDEPGSRLSLNSKSTGALILDFPESKTVTNILVLFKPLSLWYFCYSSPSTIKSCICLWSFITRVV